MTGMFTMAHSEDPENAAAKIRKRGKTVRLQFPVDLSDFADSHRYELLVTRKTMCRCPTAGHFCAKCRGKLTIRENVTLSLVIEEGSEEGAVAVFRNAGDTSEGNAPGDIEVEIVSRPHPVFQRAGSDLHLNVSITLKEALVGFRRVVKNVDGGDLVIEAAEPIGTDQIVRIPGKGLPLYLYPGEYGDIVAHANIRWPKAMSGEQRERLADVLQTAE